MIHFGDIDAYTARIEAEARSTLLVDVLAVVDAELEERHNMASTLNQTMQALSDVRRRLAALNKTDTKPEGENMNEYAEGNIVVTEDPDEDKALKR